MLTENENNFEIYNKSICQKYMVQIVNYIKAKLPLAMSKLEINEFNGQIILSVSMYKRADVPEERIHKYMNDVFKYSVKVANRPDLFSYNYLETSNIIRFNLICTYRTS